MIEPIKITLNLPVSTAKAFDTFTLGFGSWWPRDYTWSGDSLKAIGMEPQKGGRCTEVGPHGFQCDWGRVLEWKPPEELRLAWQISPGREPVPDPNRASAIKVEFESAENGCTLNFEHANFERHGDEASGYREALASQQGWPWILEQFVQACQK